MILSALRMVESRWAMTRVVRRVHMIKVGIAIFIRPKMEFDWFSLLINGAFAFIRPDFYFEILGIRGRRQSRLWRGSPRRAARLGGKGLDAFKRDFIIGRFVGDLFGEHFFRKFNRGGADDGSFRHFNQFQFNLNRFLLFPVVGVPLSDGVPGRMFW